MKLEEMRCFFDSRIDGYEDHMLDCIESAREFYPFTADLLPKTEAPNILDLGCGTGLELDYYFKIAPLAYVVGIDMSEKMLLKLQAKHNDKVLSLIQGSYFDIPFADNYFDAAVSVESLHHFTAEQKAPLYAKLFKSLKSGGYFILTDYFAKDDEEECFFRSELHRLKEEQGLSNNEFYHYDTPLTTNHEIEVLLASGFNKVEIISNWGATYIIKATKN